MIDTGEKRSLYQSWRLYAYLGLFGIGIAIRGVTEKEIENEFGIRV